MTRFINEDHAAMSTELDAEMARMGFVDDGTGNFVPAPPSQAQPQVTPAFVPPPVFEQPQYPQQPTPTPQPQSQQHNWEKREADARQAQRELSQERERILEERQLLARERAEAMSTIQALQDQRHALETQATNIPLVQQQVLTPEFKAEYPDIAEAIERAFQSNQLEISRLRQDRQKEQDEAAFESERNRRKLFIDDVRRSHPDYDGIIASDQFKQWVDVQNRSTRLVLEETFNLQLGYEPSDLVEVITKFKRTLSPAHYTPPVPPSLHSVDPGNRNMDNSSEPSDPSNFVFSVSEMRDSQLIDRWMNHPDHKRNRKAAMEKFDAAWERSVAFHNRNR